MKSRYSERPGVAPQAAFAAITAWKPRPALASLAALVLGLTVALALPTAARAQSAIVILAGEALDGTGRALGPTTIVVEGSRITGVGGTGSRPVTYDLSAYTVMPGGIDTHVHIASHFDPDGRVHRARDDTPEPRETLALYVAENAYVTLRSGITTVQSMGARIDGPVRDAIARGVLPGPRLLTTYERITEGTERELRAAVRERVAAGADAVKIFASLSIREGGVPTLSHAQLSAACDEARPRHRLRYRCSGR